MKLKRKAGLAVGVLAAVTMLIAPAAFAANTLSVDGLNSPVGDVAISGTNVGALSFNTTSIPPTPLSCTTSAVSGYAKRGGSIVAGQKLGAITQLTLGTIGMPCGVTAMYAPILFEKTPSGTGGLTAPAEWPIVVAATPAKGAVTVPVRIDSVDMKMRSASKTGSPASYVCDLRIRGSLTGTFNQTTQMITIAPPTGTYSLSNIDAYDGTGTNTPDPVTCFGQIWTGDAMRMAGVFSLGTPLGGGLHW